MSFPKPRVIRGHSSSEVQRSVSGKMVPIPLSPPSSPHFLAAVAVEAGQLLGGRTAVEPAVGGAGCWIRAMAVEAGEQGVILAARGAEK